MLNNNSILKPLSTFTKKRGDYSSDIVSLCGDLLCDEWAGILAGLCIPKCECPPAINQLLHPWAAPGRSSSAHITKRLMGWSDTQV